MSFKGSEADRHPLVCIYTIMNHSYFLLTSFWRSSKNQELLQLLFFPKLVPLQQICCFYTVLLHPPYKFFHPSWWLQGITEKGIRGFSLSWRPKTFAWGERQKEQESLCGLSLFSFFRLYSESEHLMSDSLALNSSILPLSCKWLQPLLWWPRRTWLAVPYC